MTWECSKDTPFIKALRNALLKQASASLSSSVAAILCKPLVLSLNWAPGIHRGWWGTGVTGASDITILTTRDKGNMVVTMHRAEVIIRSV